MRTIDKEQIRIVQGDNALDCEERLNNALNELACYKPHIERDSTMPFLFYVYYIVTERVAESKSDEYLLNDIYLYCQDCPHFVVPDDKRMGCRCGITHRMMKATDYICDKGIETLEIRNKLRKGA